VGFKRKALLLLSLGLFILVLTGGICRSQTTDLMSVDSFGVQDPDPSSSHSPSISSNGRYVAFESDADDLLGAGNDINGWSDIFVRDRQTATTTRASIHSDGTTEGDNRSNSPSISGDGRHVAFESWATTLVTIGDGIFPDIFVHNRQTGNTVRVSVDSAGAEGGGPSFHPSISADGRYVAFDSDSDLVATDSGNYYDIFVHDRDADEDGIYDEAAPVGISTIRVSVHSDGTEGDQDSTFPSISSDGRYVAFQSQADSLIDGDTNLFPLYDIFVHDLLTGATTLVSVDSNGIQRNGNSTLPSISADGRYVAFMSDASNLVDGDTNGSTDIFVHDRDADGNGIYDEPGKVLTIRVSETSDGVEGNGHSYSPSISADGRYVAFESDAYNLVTGDISPLMGGFRDIFVHDLQTGTTERVSVVDSTGTQGNNHSYSPSISGDGMHVAFESNANDLVAGDTNPLSDIFVHDRNEDGNLGGSGNSSSSNSGCFIATAVPEFR
jgi:Tol biopolymer transport system component